MNETMSEIKLLPDYIGGTYGAKKVIWQDSYWIYKKVRPKLEFAAYKIYKAIAPLVFARTIAPNLESDAEVYARIAFAILSANAPFDDSVKALNVTVKKFAAGKPVKPEDIVYYKMVPAKAKYLNNLGRRRKDANG